jgi:hypothetical protein
MGPVLTVLILWTTDIGAGAHPFSKVDARKADLYS